MDKWFFLCLGSILFVIVVFILIRIETLFIEEKEGDNLSADDFEILE